MKCLRVFGRNVSSSASATRKIKSNVSRARHHHRGRSASARPTLTRGAHNERRRRPRTTTGARDRQLITARTDRLWNFGVQSEQPDPHDVPGNGLSYALYDGSLYRQAVVPAHQSDASPLGGGGGGFRAGAGTSRCATVASGAYGMPWGGRAIVNGTRNGLDYMGVAPMMPPTLISDDQQQYAYGGADHHQFHRQHSSAHLKAYKRHHSLVWFVYKPPNPQPPNVNDCINLIELGET